MSVHRRVVPRCSGIRIATFAERLYPTAVGKNIFLRLLKQHLLLTSIFSGRDVAEKINIDILSANQAIYLGIQLTDQGFDGMDAPHPLRTRRRRINIDESKTAKEPEKKLSNTLSEGGDNYHKESGMVRRIPYGAPCININVSIKDGSSVPDMELSLMYDKTSSCHNTTLDVRVNNRSLPRSRS